MPIVFRETTTAGLTALTAEVPNGAIVGLIGENSPGLAAPLHLASGLLKPASGNVEASEPRRHLGPGDALNLAPVSTLALEHTLARHDALVRARARIGIERLRRAGAAILLLTHEHDLLRDLCDEIWWIHEGTLIGRGEPREVLTRFNSHIALRLQEWAASVSAPLAPSMRRGDGRARLLSVEPLDAAGRPTVVWRSGEPAGVRVTVRFERQVDDPVVGIMLRTRIGIEVYGTNTELEGVKLGPRAAGDTLAVTYLFRCDLCPQEYTLTAASHSPDGVWHDWLEDAVALTVAGSRYTAGVANLRATVAVSIGHGS